MLSLSRFLNTPPPRSSACPRATCSIALQRALSEIRAFFAALENHAVLKVRSDISSYSTECYTYQVCGKNLQELRRFPYLIQNRRSKRRFVLWREGTRRVGNHLRRALDSVPWLVVGSGLLQDMSSKDIADVVGTMRKQALDRAATGVRVVDPIALDRSSPSLVEGCLAERGVFARGLDRL